MEKIKEFISQHKIALGALLLVSIVFILVLRNRAASNSSVNGTAVVAGDSTAQLQADAAVQVASAQSTAAVQESNNQLAAYQAQLQTTEQIAGINAQAADYSSDNALAAQKDYDATQYNIYNAQATAAVTINENNNATALATTQANDSAQETIAYDQGLAQVYQNFYNNVAAETVSNNDTALAIANSNGHGSYSSSSNGAGTVVTVTH